MRFAPLVLLCFAMLAGGSAVAAPLKLCYDEVPQAPWTMPDETGLNIELLKRAAQHMGEQFVFLPKPWKRCLEEARNGIVDGVVGGADSPDRRGYLRFPLKPNGQPDPERALYSDRYLVFIRKASGVVWDGKDLLNLKGEVVAQRGYIVVDELRQHGYKVSESVRSPEEGLRMLAAGMADVAVLLGVEAEDRLLSTPALSARIEQARQVYSSVPLYLLVSRKAYQDDPKRIEAVWSAIRTVRATPAYRKLEDAVHKVRQSH